MSSKGRRARRLSKPKKLNLGRVKVARLKGISTKDRRVTGTTLQNMRLRLWTKSPHCAECGKLTEFPYGFHLDHIVPLHLGGSNDDNNLQILCYYRDDTGKEAGCHIDKTRSELMVI